MVLYVYCSNLSPHHYLPTQKNEKEIIKVRKVNVNKVERQIIIYLLRYLFLKIKIIESNHSNVWDKINHKPKRMNQEKLMLQT